MSPPSFEESAEEYLSTLMGYRGIDTRRGWLLVMGIAVSNLMDIEAELLEGGDEQ